MTQVHENDDGRELIDGGTGLPFDGSQRYAHFWWLENGYKNERASKYPPITDYLDGVVKGDQAQIDKYIADCQAIKAKYPKPEAS
jgi:hypothetical protein